MLVYCHLNEWAHVWTDADSWMDAVPHWPLKTGRAFQWWKGWSTSWSQRSCRLLDEQSDWKSLWAGHQSLRLKYKMYQSESSLSRHILRNINTYTVCVVRQFSSTNKSCWMNTSLYNLQEVRNLLHNSCVRLHWAHLINCLSPEMCPEETIWVFMQTVTAVEMCGEQCVYGSFGCEMVLIIQVNVLELHLAFL